MKGILVEPGESNALVTDLQQSLCVGHTKGSKSRPFKCQSIKSNVQLWVCTLMYLLISEKSSWDSNFLHFMFLQA